MNLRVKLRDFAAAKGVMVSKTGEVELAKGLIRKLRPMTSSFPLIRVGPEQDGGYLIPDDFDGIDGLVSPGVDVECRFDLEIAERGIPVFMADASVDGPSLRHPNFHFTPIFLDSFSSEQTVTLSDFLRRSCPDARDLLLQMDIEGAEWRVLTETTSEILNRFRGIVLEVHWLNYMLDEFGFPIIDAVFSKILKTHDVVHAHPNNNCECVTVGGITIPMLMEFTFWRKDRARSYLAHRTFPHVLDRKNVTGRPELVLPDCWIY